MIIINSAFCQKREIVPVTPKTIEHTQTYKIMEKYGFATQEFPGEISTGVYFNNVIRLSGDKGDVIFAYFLVDDGTDCILVKSRTNYGDVGYGRLMPQEINITNKIRSVLFGYGKDDWTDETVLKQVLMLIEGPEGIEELGDIDLLLSYSDGKTFLGTPIISKNLLPIDKGTLLNLNEIASEYAANYSELEWYIENFK